MITKEMLSAAECALEEVLGSKARYIMPADGMERILTAAFAAMPEEDDVTALKRLAKLVGMDFVPHKKVHVQTDAALAAMPGPAVKVKPHLRHRVTGFRGNPLRVVLSNGDEASVSQKLADSFASPSPFDRHPDDLAVDCFAAAMKEKLAKKRADGFGGWDDPEVCHIDYLAHLLAEQIHSRAVIDAVDIGNFAMMIFNRGETPNHGR